MLAVSDLQNAINIATVCVRFSFDRNVNHENTMRSMFGSRAHHDYGLLLLIGPLAAYSSLGIELVF